MCVQNSRPLTLWSKYYTSLSIVNCKHSFSKKCMGSTYFLIEFNKWITCIKVGKKMNICTLGYISVGTLSSFIVLWCASNTCVLLFHYSTYLTSHTLQIYTFFNCVHFPLQSRCTVYIFYHIQSNVEITLKKL